MAVKEEVGKPSLAAYFEELTSKGRDGVLSISCGGKRQRVLFRQGRVGLLDPLVTGRRRLGEILVSAGLTSEEDIAAALREQKRSLRFLGEILVDSGKLRREDLNRILRLQIGEELCDLIQSERYTYDFQEGQTATHPLGEIALFPVEAVVSEVARRLPEWEKIHTELPDLSTVLVSCVDPSTWPDEEQAKILSRLNGRRNVQGTADSLLRSPFEVARTLAELMKKSAVREATVEELLEQARACMDDRQMGLALPLLDRVQLLDRDRCEHGERVAELYRRAGNPQTASQVMLRMARIARAGDSAEKALRLLERALADWPRALDVLQEMVEVAGKTRNVSAEVQALKKLALLKASSERKFAIKHLERVLTLQPGDLDARRLLVDLCVRAQKMDKALHALEVEVQMVQAHGSPAEIRESYQRLLALDPSRGDIRRLLSRLEQRRTLKRWVLLGGLGLLVLIASGTAWFLWQHQQRRHGLERIAAAEELMEQGRNEQARNSLLLAIESRHSPEVAATAEHLLRRVERRIEEQNRRGHAERAQELDRRLAEVQDAADRGQFGAALESLAELLDITSEPDLRYRIRLRMRLVCEDYVQHTDKLREWIRVFRIPASDADLPVAEAELSLRQSPDLPDRIAELQQTVSRLIDEASPEDQQWLRSMLQASSDHEKACVRLQEIEQSLQSRGEHLRKLDHISAQYLAAQDLQREGKLDEALRHYEEVRTHYGTGRLRAELDESIQRIETARSELSTLDSEIAAGDYDLAHAHAVELQLAYGNLTEADLVRVPVQVSSWPAGATLQVDGVRVGRTPMVLRIPARRETRLSASLDGFLDAAVLVRPTSKPRVRLELPRAPRFKIQLPGTFAAAPSMDAEHIYAASRDGTLYRVRRDGTGTPAAFSTSSLSGTLARPLPVPGGVILTVLEGGVYLVHEREGQLEAAWRANLPGNLRSSPIALGDEIVFGTETGAVIALDPRSGSETWRIEHPGHRVGGAPVLLNDRLFVPLSEGIVNIYRPVDQELLASWDFGQDLAQPLQRAGERLLATTVAGDVLVLDPQTGKTITRIRTRDLPSAPALVHWPLIDLPLGRRLVRMDLQSGEVLQTWARDASLHGAPVLFEQGVLTGGVDGSVYALRADQPEPWFRTPLAGQPLAGGPLAVSATAVILLFQDGTLAQLGE